MFRRRPTPHFDLDYLNSLDDHPSGELFLLSSQAVAVLSDLADILLWRTRWYDGIEDLSELPALAYSLHEELNVPKHLDELVAAIYDTACCDSSTLTNTTTTVTDDADTYNAYISGGSFLAPADVDADPVGDPTTNTAIDTDSDGFIDQTEWDDYLCAAANFWFNFVVDLVRMRKWTTNVLSFLHEAANFMLTELYRRVVVGPADDFAIFTFEEFSNWLDAGSVTILNSEIDAALAELEAGREDVICDMVAATNSLGMAAAFVNGVADVVTDPDIVAWISTGPFRVIAALVWNAIFDFPTGADCTCAVLSGPYSLYSKAASGTSPTVNTVVSDYVATHTLAPQGSFVPRSVYFDHWIIPDDCPPGWVGNRPVSIVARVTGTYEKTSAGPVFTLFREQQASCAPTGSPSAAESDGFDLSSAGSEVIDVDETVEFNISVTNTLYALGFRTRLEGTPRQMDIQVEIISVTVGDPA